MLNRRQKRPIDYEKQFYDLKLKNGKKVRQCRPNAGKMNDMIGRQYDQEIDSVRKRNQFQIDIDWKKYMWKKRIKDIKNFFVDWIACIRNRMTVPEPKCEGCLIVEARKKNEWSTDPDHFKCARCKVTKKRPKLKGHHTTLHHSKRR